MDIEKELTNNSKAMAQKIAQAAKNFNENSNRLINDHVKLLDALLLVRTYVLELEKGFIDSSLAVDINKEDEDGWPAFKISISLENNQIGKLSIGVKERRGGPVLYFRSSFSDSVTELNHNQFSNHQELIRELKKTFRIFSDEIENSFIVNGDKILEENSELKELESLPLELDSSENILDSINKEVESEEEDLFGSLDLFKDTD